MNGMHPFFVTLKIHYKYNFYGASEKEKNIIVSKYSHIWYSVLVG